MVIRQTQLIVEKAPSLLDHRTYDKLHSFISGNQDTVLGLISSSFLLASEIVRNYPKLKLLLKKILFRLSLIVKKPNDHDNELKLSERQKHLIKTFKGIYGYISDIRIASNIFGIVPYISTFLKDYNSVSKLGSINTSPKLHSFITFALFASYQVFENLAFIISHDFLPNSLNHLLLPHHKNDGVNSTSDWYYAYSCRFWFAYNIIDSLRTLISGQKLSNKQILDDVLSYHWSYTTGFLNGPTNAIALFWNSIENLRNAL